MARSIASLHGPQKVTRGHDAAWPTPEENAQTVMHIVAKVGEEMNLDGGSESLPNHFVLEQHSRQFGIGTLSTTGVQDAPEFIDGGGWEGHSPLFAVSLVAPYYNHPRDWLFSAAYWTLIRITMYWTDRSAKKLRRLEEMLAAQSSGQTYRFGGDTPPTPGAGALRLMLQRDKPLVDWSGVPSSHRSESDHWCLTQPFHDVVKLRGMEVRMAFEGSPHGADKRTLRAPRIEIHKTL